MVDESQTSVHQLAEQLSEGFAALTGEYQLLFNQQKQLESKLTWAKQQYLELLKRFTPNTLSQDHLAFLQDLEHVGSEQPAQSTEWIDSLGNHDDADIRDRATVIRQAAIAITTLHKPSQEDGVRIWNGPSADKAKPPSRTKPQPLDMTHLEKDFTIAGVPSKLGCPFAAGNKRQSPLATPRSSTSRMSLRGRRSGRPSFTDPIRAEICGNDHVSASASIEGSAAVCPIRFLDQHAPEEVAKYFENHKNELPRSHEVCIKRFQSNAEGIQQLDRKYGNLVSMIQGLGQKHQEFLPPEPEDDEEAVEDDPQTDVKVENWAHAVTASLRNLTPSDEDEMPEQAGDDARTAHFDRPLKEVRVGESPSRPWGITVPAKYLNADSSSSVGSAPTASPPLPLDTSHPIGETPKKPRKCPFDHRSFAKPAEVEQNVETTETTPPQIPQPQNVEPIQPTEQKNAQPEISPPKMIPQMVFNGPVFLGYPPDQLMTLLQNSNLGGMAH